MNQITFFLLCYLVDHKVSRPLGVLGHQWFLLLGLAAGISRQQLTEILSAFEQIVLEDVQTQLDVFRCQVHDNVVHGDHRVCGPLAPVSLDVHLTAQLLHDKAVLVNALVHIHHGPGDLALGHLQHQVLHGPPCVTMFSRLTLPK